jgi:hypothetical protein
LFDILFLLSSLLLGGGFFGVCKEKKLGDVLHVHLLKVWCVFLYHNESRILRHFYVWVLLRKKKERERIRNRYLKEKGEERDIGKKKGKHLRENK